ncbi:hypothetical protein SEVIR_1G048300v4 [Setaria viridis]|uniref:Uncharacterized protein n=2 Tax=Setaria TaxID=4554 RepID=A0A368PH92_SETIT|nr:hypothetical protein SETIT_1G048600v2 [Setaria italica]RCV05021.1 hypothetical protein SETIT_1G048600v2 [Setaria italica]RCV05022.1 hypothetical protein SETIT_1G048600v2 [Setaria italica]TKW37450.1 hypothetical protein SEVIR_1G048300v2 [Setaria viridis]
MDGVQQCRWLQVGLIMVDFAICPSGRADQGSFQLFGAGRWRRRHVKQWQAFRHLWGGGEEREEIQPCAMQNGTGGMIAKSALSRLCRPELCLCVCACTQARDVGRPEIADGWWPGGGGWPQASTSRKD